MIETARLKEMLNTEPILHPLIYKSASFNYYMEKINDLNVIHIKVNRFSHNIYKKMLKTLSKIQKSYGTPIYAYGVDKTTNKLMKMAGFKGTSLMVKTTIGTHERLMLWHRY